MTSPSDDEDPAFATFTWKGTTVEMRRDPETGGMEICTDNVCFAMPATANEFLGMVEFFRQLTEGD